MKIYSKRHPNKPLLKHIVMSVIPGNFPKLSLDELGDSVIIYKLERPLGSEPRQMFYMDVDKMEPKTARNGTKLVSKRHPSRKHFIGVRDKPAPMNAGFFYCPYIPVGLKFEALGFSAKDVEQAMIESPSNR